MPTPMALTTAEYRLNFLDSQIPLKVIAGNTETLKDVVIKLWNTAISPSNSECPENKLSLKQLLGT